MKKYSEKFINNSSLLKDAVVGLELEFYMKELSYYKTLELINQYLSPIKVHGFRQYHSDFKPDSNNFKLEPDLSGGASMVELITGPMEYFECKYYLTKLLKFIQEYGYTTEKASIHFNISFNNTSKKNLNDLNLLKLILSVDEDEIYSTFPSRKNNVYAKTIKKMIPYKEYDFNNIPIDIVKNNLRFPSDKYFGVNFLHINKEKKDQRLEFRYIGGKDYEKNIGQICYFMDKFILNTHDSINSSFTNKDIIDLEYYLDQNITNFKNFSNYDSFIVEFSTINLQVDQINDYNVVSAYYPKIYTKLFSLIDATENLSNCIINYVTTTQKIEIIDATVKPILNIKGYNFINSKMINGIFDDCLIISSEIVDSQLLNSHIEGCDVINSKVLNTYTDSSQLVNCFFMNGYLNSDMEGGVFRSGKLGPYHNISSETKIVSDTDNFFNTKFDDDDFGGKSKSLKGYKK